MTREEVEKKVKEIVASELNVPEEKVVPSAHFIEDLNADSLTIMELVMKFEDEFGISISTQDSEQIRTVGDAIDFIVNKLGEKGE